MIRMLLIFVYQLRNRYDAGKIACRTRASGVHASMPNLAHIAKE